MCILLLKYNDQSMKALMQGYSNFSLYDRMSISTGLKSSVFWGSFPSEI